MLISRLGSSPRRVLIVLCVALAALVQFAVPGIVDARADNSSTLTVVGTSDVYDNFLIQNVIQPDFQKAYPNVTTFKYLSQGTGAAIATAEAGGASALIVHAASLENQFVGNGYSLEPYGRAIFWGDYVLLGPSSDPAGVKTNDPSDIAGAFEDIAAAGATGDANYVSRGGTPPPGTSVEEHKIWGLTTGVTTCTVDTVNGGGTIPSTTTGPCPTNPSFPAWYHPTGLSQALNIENADTCNYDGGNCYVLTDRGTYEYLESTNAISNLSLLSSANAAGAPGGSTLLVNSFHAYSINPNKFTDPDVQINTTAATEFLNFITSRTEQAKIGAYLSAAPGGSPFHPDARPKITAGTLPAVVNPAATVTVHGILANTVPGTPSLNKKLVTLLGQVSATPNAAPAVVAQAYTGADGSFSMSFTPPVTRTYTLSTGPLTKVEVPTLNPVFADSLQPASVGIGQVAVQAAFHNVRATGTNGVLRVTGDLYPKVRGDNGVLQVWARVAGGGKFYEIGKQDLTDGQRSFTVGIPQRARTYNYYVRYLNPGYVVAGQSATRDVTVTP